LLSEAAAMLRDLILLFLREKEQEKPLEASEGRSRRWIRKQSGEEVSDEISRRLQD
jgi:hypothetical protein